MPGMLLVPLLIEGNYLMLFHICCMPLVAVKRYDLARRVVSLLSILLHDLAWLQFYYKFQCHILLRLLLIFSLLGAHSIGCKARLSDAGSSSSGCVVQET
jgi:hypothetical protein